MKSAVRVAALALALLAPVLVRSAARADEPRVVAVTAKRFEFAPNEIHVKKGEAVVLEVTSQDVTHGLFSRQFGFDEDLTPGKAVRVPIKTDAAGSYTVICDHFCGSGHGNMKMTVVVE